MFLALFIFIFGLCVGSFINAFQYRADKEITLNGRSFCPKCKHQLSWYDLIPVFSWIFLVGKCRYCHEKISVQYPLIELLTGTLFVAVGIKSGLILQLSDSLFALPVKIGFPDLTAPVLMLLMLCMIVAVLVIIGLHDAKTGYVLSAVVYAGILLATLYLLLSYDAEWTLTNIYYYLLPYTLSGVVLAGLFFSITFFSKEKWMGAGDAEVALLMGVLLGWPKTIVAFYIALLLGILTAVLMMIRKKASMKSEIPFGPFLVTGTILAYLFAEVFLDIYDKIFI
jgi:leader peptidase (prepilin peptidase)/N-methyltransferase